MSEALSLSEILEPVRPWLEEVEGLVMKNLETEIPLLTEVGQYILASGGKRVRPAMLLFAAGVCGKITHDCAQAANIIEYIHTATLLHDDVVDSADLRRSKQSARSIWGNEASVLVGDYLFTVSFKFLSEFKNMKLVEALSRTTTLMAKGEILQLIRSFESTSEEEYLEIIYHKTATLMGVTMEFGAIIAGADETKSNKFYQVGKNIGMAFQIIDDSLEYRRDADLGKPKGADLKERKITMPLSYLIDNADEDDLELLEDVLDAIEIKDEHFDQVMELMDKYQVVDYCQKRAEEFISLVHEGLKDFPSSPYKESILKLADFVVRRIR